MDFTSSNSSMGSKPEVFSNANRTPTPEHKQENGHEIDDPVDPLFFQRYFISREVPLRNF